MKAEPLLTSTGLLMDGPLLITPRVFSDERGFFFESWNQNSFENALQKHGQSLPLFVQDNHSRSCKGVLRGLHYQVRPHPQGKLVRCVQGEIFDVAVDLRHTSATFGQWVGARLSTYNHQQLWVPEGFAHGFLTLTEYAEVLYKTTDFWHRDCEQAVRWDDPHLSIAWPELSSSESPLLSPKDAAAPLLEEQECVF